MTTTYTIQMASKLSGVGVHTIRAWEKRYRALEPLRDGSGHRVYTKSDVEKLMLLSELCLLGYTISKVAKLSIEELKAQLLDLGKSHESVENHEFSLVKDKPLLDPKQSLPILIFALKNYKLDVINQELSKIKFDVSLRDLALEIVNPLLLELRDIQSHGHFQQVQIQTFIQLLTYHLNTVIFNSSERNERNKSTIMIANIEGSNEIEILMSCLIMQHYGFNTTLLSPGITFETFCDSIEFMRPSLLLLRSHPLIVEKINNQFSNLEIYWLADQNLHSTGQFKRTHSFKSASELEAILSKKAP